MLKKKNISRRIAALSLTGLLLLCSGCGSAGRPADDEPEPSQAVTSTSPAPTSKPTPAPDTSPSPESSPTDIDASGVRPPVTDVTVEREAPDSLSFLAYKGAFTVTGADGQTLSHDGSSVSGTMQLLEQASMKDAENREVFYARIPYSEHFTFQLNDSARQYGFDMAEVHRPYFTVRTEGKVTGFEYDAAGDLLVYADAGAALDLTVGMPDSALGERGWARLLVTSAGDEVSLEVRGNTLYFSGLDHKSNITLDYGGVFSEQSRTVELSSGSGSLDFSGIAGGDIALAAS